MKSILISKKKFFALTMAIFMFLIECFLFEEFYFDNLSELLTFYATIGIFNLIVDAILIKTIGENIVSFFFIFIVCLYLFHFGQVFMDGLVPSYKYDYVDYIVYYMTDRETLNETLKLTVNLINLSFLGGLITLGGNEHTETEIVFSKNIIESERNMAHSAAFIMFVLFLPFRLYIDIKQLFAAFISGYFGSIKVAIPGVFDSLASIWYVSLILLYATSNSRKKKKQIFIGTIFYLGIKMLTGNRGHEMVILLSMFIVIMYQKGKQPIRRWIKYIVLGYVVLIAIDVVYSFRLEGISYFLSNWSELISQTASNNILFETVGTFGETIFTPYLTIQQMNSGTIHGFFGSTFIKSFVSLVPDITGALSKLNNEAILGKIIVTNHSIGGSYIAELYFNFGNLCYIIAALMGALWGKMSSKVRIALENHYYIDLSYSLPFVVQLLWWTRDSVGNYTRNVLWQVAFTWLIIYVIKRKKGRENNE